MPAAWLYADFAGGSGSAVRAAAMLTAAMLARALGRRAPPVRAFACSLLALAAWEPLVACDISFALSTGATAGLLVLQGPLAAAIVRGPAFARKLLAPAATTLAATLGCAPVLALLAPTMPILGVASNLMAAPIGELLRAPHLPRPRVLGWAPPLERGAALLGSGALLGVRAVARWSTATGAVIAVPPPTNEQLAALAVTAAAAWAAADAGAQARGARAVGAGAWLLGELVAAHAGAPRGAPADHGARRRTGRLPARRPAGRRRDPRRRRRHGRAAPSTSARAWSSRCCARGGAGGSTPWCSRTRTPTTSAGSPRRCRSWRWARSGTRGRASTLGAGPVYAALLAGATGARDPDPAARASSAARRALAGGATLQVLAPCPAFEPRRQRERQLASSCASPTAIASRCSWATRSTKRSGALLALGPGRAPGRLPQGRPPRQPHLQLPCLPRRRAPRRRRHLGGRAQPLRPPAPAHPRGARGAGDRGPAAPIAAARSSGRPTATGPRDAAMTEPGGRRLASSAQARGRSSARCPATPARHDPPPPRRRGRPHRQERAVHASASRTPRRTAWA